MKIQSPPTLTTTLRSASLASLFLAAALPVFAQTIPNPSFETDTFTVFPGYVSGNAPGITGWTGSPTNRFGLNPAAGNPFADNGTVPQGTNVAFIQGTASETITELRTDITGLTSGQKYRLNFRATVRANTAALLANLSVTIGDETLLAADVVPVNGNAPYHYVYLDFTATAATESLILRNNQITGDTTIVVDDFTIAAAPAAPADWTVNAEWYDDDSSGVDPTYKYTHAYTFGTATATSINGIPFKAVDGITPSETGKFMLTGMTATLVNDNNNALSGNSQGLTTTFVYGGNPGVLTLQGLTPGKSYVVTFYSTGWEDQGKRPVMFADGTNRFHADQDTAGVNNGITISHTYTAAADGSAVLTFQGLGGSLHLCAFSNREAQKEATAIPEFSVQPVGKPALPGDTITFSAGATGLPAPTYQWLLNGAELPGEVADTLQVFVTDSTQSGNYTLRATNSSGTVSSKGAFLEVFEPYVGPLFSTGVDESGFALLSGDPDPHYTLIANEGGELNIPAVVETPPNAWLTNTGDSVWVGPLVDTAQSPVGRFIYRTTVDAGANPTAFQLVGLWAADNTGVELRVNDQVVTGLPQSPGFNAITLFNLNATNAPSLKAGANTVDFVVDNVGGVGPTGLRVISAKVPDGLVPSIVDAPQSIDAGLGDTITLSARAYGTAPLAYEWSKDGAVIAGVTGPVLKLTNASATNTGSYTVKASNGAGTSAASPAAAVRVLAAVPGFTGTGVAADGTLLADGEADPHYSLFQNPDGEANAPALVHGSTIAPIVTGPWLASSATSKWISSRLDSANAAGGDYVYRATLNLTGFDPSTVTLSGGWTSDNTGKGIRVNGTATGLTSPGAFGALTPFTVDSTNATFVSGVNTIDFVVENTTAGYTGLRVDNIRVLAAPTTTPPGALPQVNISLSATGKPVITVTGTAGVTYPIQRSTTLGTAESPWAGVGQVAGSGQFEDTTAPAGRAFYRVVVP